LGRGCLVPTFNNISAISLLSEIMVEDPLIKDDADNRKNRKNVCCKL
jgi:hypothetical protein